MDRKGEFSNAIHPVKTTNLSIREPHTTSPPHVSSYSPLSKCSLVAFEIFHLPGGLGFLPCLASSAFLSAFKLSSFSNATS